MTDAVYPSLKGKAVLITGGGSGIGEAIVRGFAGQGSKVGFLDIADEPSEQLAADLAADGHTVRFRHCDLTEIHALHQAISTLEEELGPFSVLINNAAHDQRHTLDEVTSDYWDERFAVNLKHQFFAAQALIHGMRGLGGGAIVNMGSISWMVGQAGMVCYTTAKSAVQGLTRSLARELGPDNIRVNSIAPGWIMTERQRTLWLTPEGEEQLMEDQCLKRKLYPDDIARVALFLASDEAGGLTNQTIVVDGGWI